MRAGVIALLFFLWLISGEDRQQTDELQKYLLELKQEANVTESRTFGMNKTHALPTVVSKELVKLFHPEGKDPRAHFYHNVTGSFKGEWKIDEGIASSVNLELPLPPAPPKEKTSKDNETLIDDGKSNATITATPTPTGSSDMEDTTLTEEPKDWITDHNPTYMEEVEEQRGSFQFNKSGSFAFSIEETEATEQLNWVKGTWRLKHDDNEDYGIVLNVHGVHFVHDGSFYMWGIPQDGQMPLWHILELMPDNASFAMASAAIMDQYSKRMKKIENVMDGMERFEYPERTISEDSECHYQMYMQLGAIDPTVRTTALRDLEREWAAPQGISTIRAPHLNSTLFMYSPNCRLVLGVKNSVGMKREKLYAKAVNYAGLAGSRPERRGRRNRAAAAAAASAAANSSNNAATIPATGASTVPDGAAAEATPAAHATDTMPGGLPLPVTATRPAVAEDDSPRSDMQALYGRFYWMLIISLITLYKIAISSTRVQNLMISVCALCLFSFWIPQIVRNVIRGSKRGLSLWFVLGMSITRLALPVYFYACPENLLGHETTRWIWGLVLWVALQVSVLLLQDWLGPRFFIPKKVGLRVGK
ncbi:hypothetical protein EC968_006171 [Mortierella alpina]|nr:hypothetical protein EC968_006171 [Mortierella alpina]